MNTQPAFRRQAEPLAPSEAQVSYLNDLLAQIAERDPQAAETERRRVREAYVARTLTGGRDGTASQVIDGLKDLLGQLRKTARTQTASADRPTVPAGRYAVDTDEGTTAFYAVSVAEDGRIFVRLYSSDSTRPLPWKQSLTILHKIEEQGVLASSTRFGAEFGVCGVCGRGLTNAESRAAGIGPVCRERLA